MILSFLHEECEDNTLCSLRCSPTYLPCFVHLHGSGATGEQSIDSRSNLSEPMDTRVQGPPSPLVLPKSIMFATVADNVFPDYSRSVGGIHFPSVGWPDGRADPSDGRSHGSQRLRPYRWKAPRGHYKCHVDNAASTTGRAQRRAGGPRRSSHRGSTSPRIGIRNIG